MKQLLLIDANSIIHRSFHALPPLTDPEGRPSGAIYGLASILLRLWREEKPDYVAALFDRPEPTFRDAKYKEYKAHRAPTPDALTPQLGEAKNLFEAFGIRWFEKAGYEADDLIATFAEKFKSKESGTNENDLRVVILTGDRDTLQLVEGDSLVVKTFNKGVSDTTIYNESAVEQKYGLKPPQIVDYKALVGDPSDNIKGVPGVGPKTATELLQKFGTVKNIYKNLGSDEKLKKRFGPYIKEAELSEELVTLERNVPIDMPALKELVPAGEKEAPVEYFQNMGFDSLIKRLFSSGEDAPVKKPKKKGAGLPPAKKAPEKPKQGGLF